MAVHFPIVSHVNWVTLAKIKAMSIYVMRKF